MATYAPERPTTTELHEMFPMSPEAEAQIAEAREQLSDVLLGGEGFVGNAGPCSLTNDVYQTHREGDALVDLAAIDDSLLTLHRVPMWKPRTNPEDWHGLETTEPISAFSLLKVLAEAHANVAVELRSPEHVRRYGHLLAFGWSGSRTVGEGGTILDIALADQALPFGVKNGLDGDISLAVRLVEEINERRGTSGAPAVLIYRGGENARTPEEWRTQCQLAIDKTEGKVIIDVAHGGEMAHDFTGKFKKSDVGQIACLGSLSEVMQGGTLPAGVMIEASDIASRTDPVIPMTQALNAIRQLHTLKLRG